MRINGNVLNSFQVNFVKEMLGDVFMSDTRAEALLARLSAKYGVDVEAMLNAATAKFNAKNKEFKALEASQ